MSNNYIVVTGASGGLGKVTVLALLKSGYSVIGIDIAPSDITCDNYTFIKCDLTCKESRDNASLKIHEMTNHLYSIINLAGMFMMESIIEGNSEHLEKIVNINFFGMYYINKLLFDLLDKSSRIINISSEIAIYSPQPFMAYYAITKKMVDTYTDVLRRECNYIGIKVIKIQPGALKTKMLTRANDEYEGFLKSTKYFAGPLKKMKYMMDREITKTFPPEKLATKINKIISKKHPKIRYRIHNSFALRFLNVLPEKMQDNIYKSVIK